MRQDEEEAFIIGGAQIYRLALEAGIVDTMYLTHVDKAYEGDTWFPEFESGPMEVTAHVQSCG